MMDKTIPFKYKIVCLQQKEFQVKTLILTHRLLKGVVMKTTMALTAMTMTAICKSDVIKKSIFNFDYSFYIYQ